MAQRPKTSLVQWPAPETHGPKQRLGRPTVGVGSGGEEVHRAGWQRPCPTFSFTLLCFVY